MSRVSMTARRLRAIDAACTAMLAGEDAEGDWPEEVLREDLEAAVLWAIEQLERRNAK